MVIKQPFPVLLIKGRAERRQHVVHIRSNLVIPTGSTGREVQLQVGRTTVPLTHQSVDRGGENTLSRSSPAAMHSSNDMASGVMDKDGATIGDLDADDLSRSVSDQCVSVTGNRTFRERSHSSAVNLVKTANGLPFYTDRRRKFLKRSINMSRVTYRCHTKACTRPRQG